MGSKARRRLTNGPVLPDLLRSGLHVVFVGTAAGQRSAEVRQYYAGPGNRFWHTLKEVGLTTRLLAPGEYRRLRDYRIGLTDIAKRAFGSDHEIPAIAYDSDGLRRKMRRYRPRALAFNGKNAAEHFYGHSVECGRQEDIDETAVFVLPSTSGAARKFWDVGPWEELAAFVQ